MKQVTCVALLLYLFAGAVLCQDGIGSPDNPGLEIIKKEWQEINNRRNPELDRDPFQAINETNREMRERAQNLRQEKARVKNGLPPEPRSETIEVSDRESRKYQPSVIYVYKVKFKNTGQKTVCAITWEYVFFDPDTKAEVGRRRFKSKAVIQPGETEVVIMRSVSPPTGAIDVNQSGKKLRERYLESIIIQSVEYAEISLLLAAGEFIK